ncbi:MAG: RecX family transcriptional regulator [Deltaproteobacteria bacterium]|nr:RecX family transcriptional regulator [Deltaproteobacteria bacterium]
MPDARAIVLRLQAQGDHSEAEVRAQLERRGFSASEIEDAVRWGREAAALSDARAKESTINRGVARKRGALRVQADLERRGLDPALDVDSAAETERARAALGPQLKRFAAAPTKAAAWLARQGYEEDVCRRVVEELIGPLE